MRCDSKRRKGTIRHASSPKQDLNRGTTLVWRRIGEGRVGPVASKASPGHGGSVGNVGLVTMSRGKKIRECRRRHLSEVEMGRRGLGQMVGVPFIAACSTGQNGR
jgi:hypothetical protein